MKEAAVEFKGLLIIIFFICFMRCHLHFAKLNIIVVQVLIIIALSVIITAISAVIVNFFEDKV